MVTLEKDSFGKTKDGHDVTRFTLTNKNRVTIRILNYGATISEIIVPDKHGKLDDITLGFDDMEGYETKSQYFGAVVGRVNNRIAGAKFMLDGKVCSLPMNSEPNFLHGGFKGFDKMVWTYRTEKSKVILTYVSPDGDQNFPGELTTTVVFELTDDNSLHIDYTATTTKPTPIMLTSHPNFNLEGHASGKIDDHVVTINADSYLPLDDNSVPTGEIRSVEGLLVDLRKKVRIGDVLHDIPGGHGFDCSYVLNHTAKGKMELVARAEHPGTGRYLECYTTEPALQFYTSFYIYSMTGKAGAQYCQYGGFCLEAEGYPDSVNHENFPNIILRPGETYRQTTLYKFGILE